MKSKNLNVVHFFKMLRMTFLLLLQLISTFGNLFAQPKIEYFKSTKTIEGYRYKISPQFTAIKENNDRFLKIYSFAKNRLTIKKTASLARTAEFGDQRTRVQESQNQNNVVNSLIKKNEIKDTVLHVYNNETEIKASQSVTLKDGFFIPAGKDVRIFIEHDTKAVLAGSGDQNYIISSVIKKDGVRNISQIPSLNHTEINQTITYYDGFEQPIQVVQVMASPKLNDIIQPIAYDTYGRNSINYDPYTEQNSDGSYRIDALARQKLYYSSSSWDADIRKTDAPFSKTIFESSPLNRIKEKGSTGAVWQPSSTRDNNSGRTVVLEYITNNASTSYQTTGYAVQKWTASPVPGMSYARTLACTGLYPAGELFVKVTKGENWVSQDGKAGTIEDYVNKEGQLIVRRGFNSDLSVVSTYYVYDELGNISFILSPAINPDAGTFTQQLLDQFCHQYRYDGRGRLIEKHLPATTGWSTMLYNSNDQLIAVQDPQQSIDKKADFKKYDSQGRLIMSGLIENYTGTRAANQDVLNSIQTSEWESRNNQSPNGYSNQAMPFIYPNSNPGSVNYPDLETVNYYDDYDIPGIPNNESLNYSNKTQGLLTASKVKVLGTTDYLWSVNYYNDNQLLVKQYKQHYQGGAINSMNYDEMIFSYNFSGELITSNRIHHNNLKANTNITNRYQYDHTGRKLNTYMKLNNDAEVLLSQSSYNELGQQKQKSLHNNAQVNYYSYNERGWLKAKTSTQFSFELKYQDGVNPQYNGDISEQLWTSGNKMVYTYDKLGRLSSGVSSGMSEYITYDNVGNIKSLNRDGVTRNYLYEGNRLSSTSGATGTGSFLYDANGNVKYDGRLAQVFLINRLNLPSEVPGLQIKYVYDADGNKIRKISSGVQTDYIDGIQYTNGEIDFIQTEEGIARRNGVNYSYEYNLTDHLGNVRYSFYKNNTTQSIERLQNDDYYPFGLRKSGQPVSLVNRYLYGGKEIQEETSQYDFGARFYDPNIGRWNSPDPVNQFDHITPYAGMANSPAVYTDPDGRIIPLLAVGIGALIGGGLNLGAKILSGKVHNFGDGLVAFGIGAVAGGVGVASGGAALAGTSFAANSVLGGIVVGAVGSTFSATIQGYGNMAYFGDPVSPGSIGKSALLGAFTSGIVGGISASPGVSIWTGKGPQVNPGQLTMVEFGGRTVNQSADEASSEAALWSQKAFSNKPNGNVPAEVGFKDLQATVRSYAKEMNEFFKSGGNNLPSNTALESYKDLATRILNGTGGAPVAKASKVALEIQQQRLDLINKALKSLK